jgi:hypothetical protein
MTISYVLAPIPKWYFADNAGRPLAGGTMQVKSSLNPALDKQVFQDPTGTNPYPNPVVFAENGTAGPFYWRIDSTQPQDLYFLDVFDSNGNPIFNVQDYPIAGGGGGGGGGTTALPIKNLIVNNSFINNIGATSTNPIADNTFLSPSAHSNLEFPDMTFFHTGTLGAVDTITFNPFTPFGLNPFGSDYVTPYYVNYSCSNNPVAELTKGYRIPLAPFVATMAGQTFSVKFRARCNSGANTINVRALQYFGTGGTPSPSVRTVDVPFNLTNVWTEYSLFIALPVVAGQTPGNSQDDGTYLEISLPINQNTSIDIAKVACYPGTIVPLTDFESVEEIEAQAETPRTGDIRISANGFSNNNLMNRQAGWIPLNDGTIGDSSSGATTRAKPDAWLLYQLLFDNTVAADCPLFDNTGAPIAKSGTALSNWNDHNRLKLPVMTDSVPANRGTESNALGHHFGAHTATLLATNLPPHKHQVIINANSGVGLVDAVVKGNGAGAGNVVRNSEDGPGTSAPFGIDQPTTYYNMIIKL